jgi:UDP-N-acetylglucosamine--dolichyl-phosphate N-acetylglucosaminephosphotransferase
MDDLFDIRWRHKFFLPAIASIPLLIVYHFEFNQTSILIPKFISQYYDLSSSINLGIGYYFYMASVSIFCPNSINILAGINGLEVGQTIIIAVLLVINDIYYIAGYFIGDNYKLMESAYEIHLFSLCFLIPFLGIAIGLFKYNKYPAKVFVGDTWCYFSGMVFAVLGISGHFAKTLMLFFLPQIVNFIYSAPQLFGIIPCPRHRLPKFNETDGLLYNSYTEYFDSTNTKTDNEDLQSTPKLKTYLVPIFTALEKLHLIKLVRNSRNEIIKSSNLTLINLVIIWFGPRNEGSLCALIMLLQFLVGFVMLVLRHTLAPILFGFDNSWTMLNRFYV